MTTENELKRIFEDVFSMLKQEFYKNNKIEDREEDTRPDILSFRDMIESLPPSIQITELTSIDNQLLKHRDGFLIKYDFDKLKSDHFEFSGSIEYDNIEKLAVLISEKFHFDEKNSKLMAESIFTRSFRSTWNSDDSWYLHFIGDDIIGNPSILYEEAKLLFLSFPDTPILHKKFETKWHEDYNTIYGLSLDPILQLEELVKGSEGNSLFNLNLEKIQTATAELQLIPMVPDEIKQVFTRAKDLFIFGYFRYEFFTIAEHYAYLALEAAIKIRYVKCLGDLITLTDSKNDKLKHEIKNPTYYSIEEFCRNNKDWNIYRLLVNGEPFQVGTKKLVDWLVTNHYIRKWEKNSYESGMNIRNILSHLERPQTHMPTTKNLQLIANQINFLFHSLKN